MFTCSYLLKKINQQPSSKLRKHSSTEVHWQMLENLERSFTISCGGSKQSEYFLTLSARAPQHQNYCYILSLAKKEKKIPNSLIIGKGI